MHKNSVAIIGSMQRKRGELVLALLSLLLLPVGGGFVPVWIGLVAGAAGVGLRAPVITNCWKISLPCPKPISAT